MGSRAIIFFEHPGIDYEMWIRDGEQPLPCKLLLTYKLDEGAPKSVLTFSGWDVAPDFAPELFSTLHRKGMPESLLSRSGSNRTEDRQEGTSRRNRAGRRPSSTGN